MDLILETEEPRMPSDDHSPASRYGKHTTSLYGVFMALPSQGNYSTLGTVRERVIVLAQPIIELNVLKKRFSNGFYSSRLSLFHVENHMNAEQRIGLLEQPAADNEPKVIVYAHDLAKLLSLDDYADITNLNGKLNLDDVGKVTRTAHIARKLMKPFYEHDFNI